MKIKINRNFGDRLLLAMRKCGYSIPRRSRQNQPNFTRRLGNYEYPHFHVYLRDSGDGWMLLTLHLDQKKPSYGHHTAHSGDYDTPEVIKEGERLKYILENI